MQIYTLRISGSEDTEEQNVFDFTKMLIQFSYDSIKKSYRKGEGVRRAEYKIFKKRLQKQVDIINLEDYDFNHFDLEFLNKTELKWFYGCLETYIYDNNLQKVSIYDDCLKDFKSQLSKMRVL